MPDIQLGLIVGAARSGTTLMRLLLDEHPEIGCPAEAGLPGLMSHMTRVWATIDADIDSDAAITDPGAPTEEGLGAAAPAPEAHIAPETNDLPPLPLLPDAAKAWLRDTMLAAMGRYCDRVGKRLYVDKSLDSVFYLDLVQQVFPDVRCVLSVRHVMDTIASGIEASPWGFQAYGYGPYIQSSPGNSVAALARYWLDHVSQALEWEKRHPEACIRVRYEDLVLKPEETMSRVQHFLGVSEDYSALEKAFQRGAHKGPGDYKVEHTGGVHSRSIGHGKRVPLQMIPPPLLSAINERLEALDYPVLDQSWNAAERVANAAAGGLWRRQLQTLMDSATTASDKTLGPFALVAEDDGALRWVIDPVLATLSQGDGEVEAVLTGTTQDLVLMLTDDENLGVLMRSGRIRYVVANDDEAARRDNFLRASAAVAYARNCVSDIAVDRDH
jgi:sulfotransferase family protein